MSSHSTDPAGSPAMQLGRPGYPRLRMLPEASILRIHEASIRILERTGVDFLADEAIRILSDGGAQVIGPHRVRIPRSMVESALASTPRRIPIYDREGKLAMDLSGHNFHYGTGSDTPNTIDPYTGQRRPSVKADIGRCATVCDWLPNIDYFMCMGLASDVDHATSDLHHFQEMVTHTTKPLVFTSWGRENIRRIYDMCVAVRGRDEAWREKPFAILYSEPTSPLRHTKETVDLVLFCADRGIPHVYISGPLMGAMAPATQAGAIALANAEFLSGLVLAQLRRPGAPIIYGGGIVPMDMRTSVGAYDAPELLMNYAVERELASYYGLPIFGTAGCSDSKVLDQQAAMEATWQIILAALSGNNLIHDVGYLESGLTACYELIVLCDEAISMSKHFLKGVPVDDETLAVDVVDAVGPGGSFLTEEHTLRHYRESWYPRWLDRRRFAEWQKDGGKTLGERLNEQVRWILENHQAPRLPAEVEGEIARIVEKAV